MKLVKWIAIIASGTALLCLSPFIILFLTHYASKPFNNQVLGNLVSNYKSFEHPNPSEQVGEITSFMDTILGNGDHWGPCVMKVNDIRKTSISIKREDIVNGYQKADLQTIKKSLPTLKGMGGGFSISFVGDVKENSYLHNSELPYDTIWLSRYNEMSKRQKNDPAHLYYLLSLELPSDMIGLDWRCIII